MVIARDIAKSDIEKYLDFKRKSEAKRTLNVNNIDTLVDAVSEGDLVINEDCSVKQILRYTVEDKNGKAALAELVYKPRLKAETLQAHLQGVKSDDVDGRINAHIAALSSNPKDIVKKMDYDDYAIASAFVQLFFFIDEISLSNMVRSVAREFRWPPDLIGGFFIDDQDWFGLEFWYNDCVEAEKKIKDKTKK